MFPNDLQQFVGTLLLGRFRLFLLLLLFFLLLLCLQFGYIGCSIHNIVVIIIAERPRGYLSATRLGVGNGKDTIGFGDHKRRGRLLLQHGAQMASHVIVFRVFIGVEHTHNGHIFANDLFRG